MKNIFLIALLTLTITAGAQQTSLLMKYRAMSLEYNHDLKAALKNIEISLELEKSARADSKPKISGGLDGQYTGNPMALTLNLPALGAPTTFQGQNFRYGAAISIFQPVYTGGRVLESIRLAEHQQTLARSSSDVVRSAVCFQTDIQYWSTVARGEMVRIATDFRNSIQSLVVTIGERVDAGLIDPQDLLMAQVKLNEADYQLLRAQSDLQTGRMALNSLIGNELSHVTLLDDTIPDVEIADSLLSIGGDHRAEITAAQSRISIAQSKMKLTDSKYLPQLYVGVDGSYSSPGYNFNKDLNPNYAVYAKLSVPIFEWGKRHSEKRASNQQIGIASDNLNSIVDQVNLEVATARTSLTQAIQRVTLSLSSLGKAEQNERQAIERYAEGKVSIIEVIDAQTYRQTSQINYVQAKVAAQGHYTELLKALNSYDF